MKTSRIDLSRIIGVLVVMAGVTALVGVAVGGAVGRGLDVAAVTALAAAPGVRVLALAVAWVRLRDYKYAAASLALILLIMLSVIGTALWR
ncbi:MAG: hypothetical protein EBV14_02915 [Actinobacteria bacterium]|nr:hypothetical protein [Actinomycetota bacterium]NBX13082.1 hypothetical protein [Acidimicrobiia bacterium]NDG10909.1 hypothetical protein [Actinomycetota bacterium]